MKNHAWKTPSFMLCNQSLVNTGKLTPKELCSVEHAHNTCIERS